MCYTSKRKPVGCVKCLSQSFIVVFRMISKNLFITCQTMRGTLFSRLQAVIILMCIPCTCTAGISEFTRVREHAQLGTVNTKFVVLSLLDCSVSCSSITSCDGFNFYKFDSLTSRRECVFLNSNDVSDGVLTWQQDSYVYVKDAYVKSFEEKQVNLEVDFWDHTWFLCNQGPGGGGGGVTPYILYGTDVPLE